jgi:hypothetical protein
MEFSVQCECGCSLPVKRSQAGAELTCKCGRVNIIPSLAQLRRAVGLVGVEETPEEKIGRDLSSGLLPGEFCIKCCGKDADTLRLKADCEQSYAKGNTRLDPAGFILSMVLPFTMVFAWTTGSGTTHGHDNIVSVPLKLCSRCRSPFVSANILTLINCLRWGGLIGCVAWMVVKQNLVAGIITALLVQLTATVLLFLNQRALRAVVKSVPQYGDLLKKFPNAEIKWQ